MSLKRVVWKKELERWGSGVFLPIDSIPLSFGIQNNTPVVWFLTDPDEKEETAYAFRIYFTGEEVSYLPEGLGFVGTATDSRGLVHHLFMEGT